MIAEKRQIRLSVNGRAFDILASPDAMLIDILRNQLGLKGTRFGCGTESCGACMVMVDGIATCSCTRMADSVEGHEVTTVESLGAEHSLHRAFIDQQAGQCGYCLSGILMSAKALLDRKSSPERSEVIAALEPHLCRCGAHIRIVRAIEQAAAIMGSDRQ